MKTQMKTELNAFASFMTLPQSQPPARFIIYGNFTYYRHAHFHGDLWGPTDVRLFQHD